MTKRAFYPIFAHKKPSGRFLRAAAAAAVGFLGALAACSSDPTLYTLAPAPGPVAAGGPVVVEVRTPVVPTRLDRDTIVKADRHYETKLASGDTWSEPLGEMMAHVLRTDLAARLPSTTVFAQNDAVPTTSQAFVELTVNQFEADADGYAVVSGALSVHPAGTMVSPVLTYPVHWRSENAVSGRTGFLVAALSKGLGQIADQAAAHLRSLPPVVKR